MGGIPVAEEEWEMLLETGLTAIRRLHEAGVAHRDATIPNLQVARKEDEKVGVWDKVMVMTLSHTLDELSTLSTGHLGSWKRSGICMSIAQV